MSTTATGVAAAVTEARQRKGPVGEEDKTEMEEVEINPGVILDARREVRAKLYMGQVRPYALNSPHVFTQCAYRSRWAGCGLSLRSI